MDLRGVAFVAIGGAILLGAVVALGLHVESASGALGGAYMDLTVARWAAEDAPSWLRDVMRVVTWGGASLVVLPVLLASAIVAQGRSGGSRVTTFLIITSAGLLLSSVAKGLVERPRPVLAPLVNAGGSAFPSGHTTAGALLFGGLAVATTRLYPERSRAGVWVVASLGALLVGASRIVLGVHWTTDVIGGLLLGAGWVFVGWKATFRRTGP